MIGAAGSDSDSPTALFSSSGTAGGNSYNTWQWGGFSRSTSYVPANDAISQTLSMSKVLLQAADLSDESVVTTSLSGYVFFDENGNGKMETTDWGIIDAKLSLTKTGSGDPPLITYTDSKGTYTFNNLSPGTYSIALLTECPEPGIVILGQLYDADGKIVPNAGKVTDDGFYDIVLEDGYQGVNYIFGESVYPALAVSKRLLIEGGPEHTVPEPATLVLLAIAGLVLGGYARRRV
ncbi:MAG: PEP-CTERM sorting domain-containing protein [Planctomycetes bacterium]|nr:PEP-CTERM sorting domain-containing protein [Planctomycetota bacterium]